MVFFCGAGICYPARLPSFSDLVDRLYQALSVTPNPVQQSAIKAGQFDTAIRALPAEGLRESAEALVRALEGAGDQREDYWKNRVLPFWEKIWPNSNDKASDANAESLARLCIAAGDEFPSAMATLGNWLRVVQHPDYVIHRLQKSGLSARFPEDALLLLYTILGDQPSWLTPKLRQCLDAIGQANPNLRQDHRFMRVDELARKFGI